MRTKKGLTALEKVTIYKILNSNGGAKMTAERAEELQVVIDKLGATRDEKNQAVVLFAETKTDVIFQESDLSEIVKCYKTALFETTNEAMDAKKLITELNGLKFEQEAQDVKKSNEKSEKD